MIDREKVIEWLKHCPVYCNPDCPCYWDDIDDYIECQRRLHMYAIDLLEAQECATVEPKRLKLSDETRAWFDKMDAVEMLSSIADICIDWDGHRTANGLGGLINEIWAYARYGADKLTKEQSQQDYEAATEMTEYCECYEPTYNPEDGSL